MTSAPEVSRFRRRMREVADWLYGTFTGRTRAATHRRREEENILAIQEAVADLVESNQNLLQHELDMLWDRHDRRHHHRT